MRTLDQTELHQVSGGFQWPPAINFSVQPWPPQIHQPTSVRPISSPRPRPTPWEPIIW